MRREKFSIQNNLDHMPSLMIIQTKKQIHTVYSLDLTKCRRNIMLHNKEDYPVFTVLEKVQPYVETQKIKPGLYSIETSNYFLFVVTDGIIILL